MSKRGEEAKEKRTESDNMYKKKDVIYKSVGGHWRMNHIYALNANFYMNLIHETQRETHTVRPFTVRLTSTINLIIILRIIS